MGTVLCYRAHFALFSVTLLGLLGAASAARAQGHASSYREVHGRVNHEDGTPFTERARVTIEDDQGGLAAQIVSDARGKFDANQLYKSHFTITVHANGFQDVTTHVDLIENPREYIQITLHALSSSTAAATPASPSSIVSVNDLNVPEVAQVEFENGRGLVLDKHKPSDSVKPFLKAIQIAPS